MADDAFFGGVMATDASIGGATRTDASIGGVTRTDALRGLAAEVAERTTACPVTVWGFGVGGALAGLVRAGRVLGREDLVGHVAALVGPSLDAPAGPTDHLIAVEALLELRAARPGTDVDGACRRWLHAVREARRPVGGGPRVHRPDLARWRSTVWVDCMHTDGPGLAALGHAGEAAAYAEEYAAVLQRGDGLFHHGYDTAAGRGNGVAWGRGQAWALLGLTGDGLYGWDAAPHKRLVRLVEALAAHEDGGRWHTVVDDPGSPVEDSVAAYVAYAVPRAVRYGLLDAGHLAMAERAFATTVGALRGGGLTVSEATPVDDDPAGYHRRATGVFPWGQAPVLHALLDRIGADGEIGDIEEEGHL